MVDVGELLLTPYQKTIMVSIRIANAGHIMFEHLLVADPGHYVPWDSATPQQVLAAQEGTADWLTSHGIASAEELIADIHKPIARETFAKIATGADADTVKQGMQKLTTPAAVRHLVAMLDAYDWEFVYQAQKLRGYAVAKILEDTQLPDPRHRLRALEMLGKITEVGLFTERVEITKVDLTDEALEAKIKQKLDKFRSVIDVSDVLEQPKEELALTNKDMPE